MDEVEVGGEFGKLKLSGSNIVVRGPNKTPWLESSNGRIEQRLLGTYLRRGSLCLFLNSLLVMKVKGEKKLKFYV